MIIIGYPCIGKSTLSRKQNLEISDKKSKLRFIDLESSNFKFAYKDGCDRDGKDIIRINKAMLDAYINTAVDLSSQGYCVFVSSHEAVQKALREVKVDVYVCYPALTLHEKWTEKARKRYIHSYEFDKDKNLTAYNRIADHYEEDIRVLTNSGFKEIIIYDMDYDLYNDVNSCVNDNSEFAYIDPVRKYGY